MTDGGAGGAAGNDGGVAGSGSGGASLLDGCVLLLHLDEADWSSGPETVTDASGQGNHGTAVGSAVPTAAGRFGGAAALDGDGWIEVDDAPSLRPTAALTVSAWVYATRVGTGYWPGVVTKRAGYGVETAFSLHLGESGEVTVDLGLEADRFSSTTLVQEREWTHLAFVYDGRAAAAERVRLYLDGALEAVAYEAESTLDPTAAAPLYVGNLVNGGSVFEGRIDEVAVWRRALDAAEIAALGAGPVE